MYQHYTSSSMATLGPGVSLMYLHYSSSSTATLGPGVSLMYQHYTSSNVGTLDPRVSLCLSSDETGSWELDRSVFQADTPEKEIVTTKIKEGNCPDDWTGEN